MELIFSKYGIIIETDGTDYFLSVYDASSAGAQISTYKVTEKDAHTAQLSEKDAYDICLKCQNMFDK